MGLSPAGNGREIRFTGGRKSCSHGFAGLDGGCVGGGEAGGYESESEGERE